jgi:hypothetical protein
MAPGIVASRLRMLFAPEVVSIVAAGLKVPVLFFMLIGDVLMERNGIERRWDPANP